MSEKAIHLPVGSPCPPDEKVEYSRKWIKHVYCDGARWHVLSWSSLGTHCSEKNCIVNKDKLAP